MSAILAFFSDLILFTAGLAVVVLWCGIITVVTIEIYDAITGNDAAPEED